ncbi:MAG TPA: hypothetical protein VHQ41_02740 [Patescibacteria group bacterium]|jgi:hypothetical protein|nr:hypothetical protein [Patescibacteria group bacterium]
MMNKKLLIAVGVLVIAAAALAAIYFFHIKKNQPKPFAVETKTLDAAVLPSGFPKNMPIEAGSTVLQNYEATTTDGRKQSTRVATTNKTLTAALKDYSDYFVHLGWTLIPNTDAATNTTSALLRYQDRILVISGSTNDATKQNSVSLTLTESFVQAPASNIKK